MHAPFGNQTGVPNEEMQLYRRWHHLSRGNSKFEMRLYLLWTQL